MSKPKTKKHNHPVRHFLTAKLHVQQFAEPLSVRERIVGAIALIVAVNAILGYSGVATTQNVGDTRAVPAGSCGHDIGWDSSTKAGGLPSLDSTSGEADFTFENSAVLDPTTNGALTCGSFDFPPDSQLDPAIAVSFAVTQIPEVDEAVDEVEEEAEVQATDDTLQPPVEDPIEQNSNFTYDLSLLSQEVAETAVHVEPSDELPADSLAQLEISGDNGENWQAVYAFTSTQQSNFTNSNYVYISLPPSYLENTEKLQARVVGLSRADASTTLLVDSLFMTYEIGQQTNLSVVQIGENGDPLTIDEQLVSTSDSIVFEFTTQAQDDTLVDGVGSQLNGLFGQDDIQPSNVEIKTQIINSSGETIEDVETNISYKQKDTVGRDVWEVEVTAPAQFTPGEHTAHVSVSDTDGATQSIEQDFLWGVLAINTDKSAYTIGDNALLQLAVLNDNGEPVCDAEVTVGVYLNDTQTDSLSTKDNRLTVADSCSLYEDHIEADYSGKTQFSLPGTYELRVQATTRTGSYSIVEVIEVSDTQDYSVQRTGPTRIYPPLTYPMIIEVTTADGFSGTVVERVPRSFEIETIDFAENYKLVYTDDRYSYIEWDVTIAAGESKKLGYSFDAPDIAPEFFLAGPLEFKSTSDGQQPQLLHTEQRQWQIASDALADIAIYREATGADVIGTTVTNIDWDTTTTQGAPYSLQANTIDIDLADAGHYFVTYTLPTQTSSGSNRSEIQSWLRLNDSTDLAYGRGQGYIRRSGGADEGYNHGAAIIDVSAGDDIRLQAQRTDDNSATVERRANKSGINLVKLDDDWDYLRSRPTSDQTIGSTTSFETVTLATDDEIDSASFSRSGGTITIAEAGHYLVTFNIGVTHTDGGIRINDEARLTLDGTEIDGTRVSTYVRGTNSTNDGMLTWTGIIETTAANQDLVMEIRRESEVNPATHNTKAAESGIAIARLPDDGDYIRLGETGGGQDLSTSRTSITWDETLEEDTDSFDHDATNTERINIEANGDYLFFHSLYSARPEGNANREAQFFEWQANGLSLYEWGSSGQFNRGDQGAYDARTAGSSTGFVANSLTDTDYIELTQINETANATSTYQADRMGVQAVQLQSLIAPGTPIMSQTHFRWRDDTTDLNSSGGYLAAEDSNAISSIEKNTNYRLRIAAANTGTGVDTVARSYELQFGRITSSEATCSAITTWTGLNDSATDAFEIAETPYISPDGEATNPALLANSEAYTYVFGEGRESADTTGTIGPLNAATYTELEYSIEATDEAIPASQYCFRLFDANNTQALTSYVTFPTVTVASVAVPAGLGEAGTFTSAVDGGWTTVNFIDSYTTPVVVGNSNSHNGQAALVFEARNVTSTSADMRVCESEGSSSNGCDTHAAETVGYLVIDAAETGNYSGIEAGTFSVNGDFTTTTSSPTYVDTYSTAPYVFANVNTVNDTEVPIEVVVTTTSTTGFTAGICDHSQTNSDACDNHGSNETVGWVAIDPSNSPFDVTSDIGLVSIGNSTWTNVSFTSGFDDVPSVIVESQTDTGAQNVEINEARSVSVAGADVRFCEIDTLDSCDTHSADDVAWVAIEQDTFHNVALNQDTYRWYANANSTTPGAALSSENTAASGVADGGIVRLRMAVQAGTDIAVNDIDFTLQYGAGEDCSLIGSWTDVGGLGSGSIWRGYNNGSPADETTLPTSLLNGGGNQLQTYEEENDSATNPTAIATGQRGEWDWVLENNGATESTNYCFRMVGSGGDPIQYSRYAELITEAIPSSFYVERANQWTTGSTSTWQDINLSNAPYNVPANSAVEITIMNADASDSSTAGVRQNGSSLSRFTNLHEAEGGGFFGSQGNAVITMHVQTDATGVIEYYTDNPGETTFMLDGYWESGSYVEGWSNFTAGASNTWQDVDLSGFPYDVPVNRVIEIVGQNGEDGAENQIGVRRNNSSLSRIVDVQEAENPADSFTTVTFFTQADQNSLIEVFAEDNSNVNFYYAGYWDIPPGYYNELATTITNPTSDSTWQARDLTAQGIADNAVVEVIAANGDTNTENEFGSRTNGSALNRIIDLVEAESGGSELWRNHVPTDTSGGIQLYHEDVSDTPVTFHMTGVWTPNIEPDDPVNLDQQETDTTSIPLGNWLDTTTVKFEGDISDVHDYEVLELCIEAQLLGVDFTDVETACSSEFAYNGTTVTVDFNIGLASGDNEYHWQAATRDLYGAYSNWVSFGANAENERDVGIDTTPPVPGIVYDGTATSIDADFNDGALDSLSANWAGYNAGGSGLDRYELSIGTSQGATDVLTWTDVAAVESYTANSLSLRTTQTYYVNVRAFDIFERSGQASSDGMYVAPTLSFAVSPTNVTFDSLNPSNSFTDTETVSLTTSTNAYNGYNIRAYTLGVLNAVSNPDTIGFFNGGTYAAPDGWLASDRGWGYHSDDSLVDGVNRFNSSTCLGGNPQPCFAPFSTTAPGDIIADNTGPITATPITNEIFTITQRVGVDQFQVADEYQGTVIYTVTPRY
ncbi:TPA: hypothetical protein EYO12_03940 [Candidatus Saccharibacteria bacterium]|nr:hypothetical protein [Candidatus Saccharibacteria bacterium]HIO87814.1 hypothetical protein [Candidatus Saccharibacteria bacterium]